MNIRNPCCEHLKFADASSMQIPRDRLQVCVYQIFSISTQAQTRSDSVFFYPVFRYGFQRATSCNTKVKRQRQFNTLQLVYVCRMPIEREAREHARITLSNVQLSGRRVIALACRPLSSPLRCSFIDLICINARRPRKESQNIAHRPHSRQPSRERSRVPTPVAM